MNKMFFSRVLNITTNNFNKTNLFYIFKRYQTQNKKNFYNFIEYNQPMIIEYTPQSINIEYLVGCCEKECKKCKFSSKYDEKAKECCGNDCKFCPDIKTKYIKTK